MKLLAMLRTKFVRDSATLQIGALINACGNFLSSVVVAHLLGAHLQGIYFVTIAFFSFFFFTTSLGVLPATVSQVAAASARGLTEKVAQWLAFLLKAHLLLAAVLVGLGWFVLPAVAELVYGTSELPVAPRQVGIWAWWLCFMPLLELPKVVCIAAFQGTRRMLPLAQTENASEAIRVVLVVVGAMGTGTPAGPLIGWMAASFLSSFVALDLYRRAQSDGGPPLPTVRDVLRRWSSVPVRRGMRLGVRIGLLRNVDALAVSILPPLIIQRFGTSEYVAYFRVAMSTMKIPFMMMQGMSRTALPAMSRLAGLQDAARFRELFVRVTLLGGLMIAIGILGFLPLVPWIVGELYPAGYVEPVWLLARILAVGFVCAAFAVAIDAFYIATDRLRVALRVALACLLITVPLSAVLAWLMPRTGAAWGAVSSMGWTLVHYAYIALYFRRQRADEAAATPSAAG